MKDISRTVLTVTVCLILIGSIFLIYPNSRSSILIKELVTVAGGALVLLILSVSVITGRKLAPNRINPQMIVFFLLIIGWMVLRHHTGIGSVNAEKTIFNFMACGGILFVIAASFNRSGRDTVLWVLMISTIVLSIYSILQSMGLVIFSWDSGLIQQARSSGTLGNANLLGSFTAAMLPVGTGFLLGRHRLSKFRIPAAVVYSLLCTGALIASKTRGSLIGLLAILILIPFTPVIRRNRKRLIPVFLLLLVLIAGTVFMMQNRMQELVNPLDTGTLQVRKLIWSGTLSMIAQNPLIGWGPGSFQILFPQFRNPEYFLLGVSHNTLHAHCEYMEILVDGGIVALLLFGTLGFFVYRKSREIKFHEEGTTDAKHCEDWTVIGLIGGILSLLAEATVSVALRWPISSFLLALLLGLMLCSIQPVWRSLKGYRKFLTALALLLCAVFLGLIAFPHYMTSMLAGRQLFLGKDVYLTRIQPSIENAVNSASAWSRSGSSENMQSALYYYDTAAIMADSSVMWCLKSVETNPDDLGGWYALGSAYISRGMLYRPLSAPMISILQMNGRTPYDIDYSIENVLGGLTAYDSLVKRAPNYAEVNHNLALVWTNLGNPDSVLSRIRTAWNLHAHNRSDYIKQTELIGVLSDNMNSSYIHMLGVLEDAQEIMDHMPETKFRSYYRILLLYTGTAFLGQGDQSDSLFTIFAGLADSLVPDLAPALKEDMALQIRELDREYWIIDRLREEDFTDISDELDRFEVRELEILPAHITAMGIRQLHRDEIQGAYDLCFVMRQLIENCFNNLISWPMNPVGIKREIDGFLIRSELETPELRELFLRSEIDVLLLDRRIFNTWNLMNSSPGFRSNVPENIQEYLSSIWSDIGGPLFCISGGLGNADSLRLLFAPGSCMSDAYSGLQMLQAESPGNAELLKLEIAWFYTIYQSFYFGAPSVSLRQSEFVIDRLRDIRLQLVAVLGEDEVRYQLGFMFESQLSGTNTFLHRDYIQYVEMLKSDLLMGRI